MPSLYVHAGWVLPVVGPPIHDAAVLIAADGRIEWVGEATSCGAPPGVPTLSRPEGVAVPGLVDAHTHLELTHLAELAREPAFPAWIARVRALKEATAPEEFEAAARIGVLELWAQGVTTVADTGSTGAAARALGQLGGSGIAFQETFGPDPADVYAAGRLLNTQLAALAPCASARVRIGVSPHAPYSVSAPLVVEAFGVAARQALPVAMHVAESPEETVFVRDGAGPFAEHHRRRGIPVRGRARSTVAWLEQMGVLDQRPLCIHAVHTDDDDIRVLADRGVPVAHCPRANRAHGHGRAPLERWRAAGVRVGLGTDSVASLTPLDLRAEARMTGLSAAEQVALLTAAGADVLGLNGLVGGLAPGAWGDLALFARDRRADDPYAAALLGRTVATVVGGRVVYDGSRWPDVDPEAWRSSVARARGRLGASAGEPAASR